MLTADVMSDPWLAHFRATQALAFTAESVFPAFSARRNLSIYCWHWSWLTPYLHVSIILQGVVPKYWSSFVCTIPVRTSASVTSFKPQWLLYVPPRLKLSGPVPPLRRSGFCVYHRIENTVFDVCNSPSKHSGCSMYHSFKALWLMYVPPRLMHSDCCIYTLFNKNQAAWNFIRPTSEVTSRRVAIIIRVVLLSPYLVHSRHLCLPFITINHAMYILTKATNTFTSFVVKTWIKFNWFSEAFN
jgi:hypothetical protein